MQYRKLIYTKYITIAVMIEKFNWNRVTVQQL